MIDFKQGIQIDVRKHIKVIEHTKVVDGIQVTEKARHVPWAIQLALSGNPVQRVVETPEGLVRPLFGGGVVSITQGSEVVFLPVTNASGAALAFDEITARDLGDTISRLRARAAAVCCGVGLGLWIKDAPSEDGAPLSSILDGGISNESTRDVLLQMAPIASKKKARNYLPWAAALAVARITDPDFTWRVEERTVADQNGEQRMLPAVRCGSKGWMVGVTITWRGVVHTEWLPIMGVVKVQTKKGMKPMDNQPLVNPTATDWHRAVMRCLAKGLAITTGYGYNHYAQEVAMSFLGSVVPANPTMRPVVVEDTTETLTAVRQCIAQLNADEGGVARWIGVERLEDADLTTLSNALASMQVRLEQSAATV